MVCEDCKCQIDQEGACLCLSTDWWDALREYVRQEVESMVNASDAMEKAIEELLKER